MEAHEGSMKAGVDLTPGFAGLVGLEERENKSASNTGALVFSPFETHDRPPKAAVRSTPAESRFIRASWSFMPSW
jgi:hypothetical protein